MGGPWRQGSFFRPSLMNDAFPPTNMPFTFVFIVLPFWQQVTVGSLQMTSQTVRREEARCR